MKKLMAILLAALLAASALPVLADENVSGSVSDIEAANGQITYKDSSSTTQTISGTEASFTGDVTAGDNMYTIKVDGDGYTISVTGDVDTGTTGGVLAKGESDVSVTGDITGASYGISASKATVTVEGEVTATSGTGVVTNPGATVTINNEGDTAVEAFKIGANVISSTVTITGDIVVDNTTNKSGSGVAVYGRDGGSSELKVTGNITANSSGVSAYGASTVTVEGNITVTGNFNGISDGVTTGNTSRYTGTPTVSVTGDINATRYGVSTTVNGSTITVDGDITTTGDNSWGVKASGNSTVSVTGDISAKYYGIEATGSTVAVEGDITAEGNSDGIGYGVFAKEESTVSVTGDIDAESIGVYATGSTVTVDGDVTGKTLGVMAMMEGTEITVRGDVSGGKTGMSVLVSAEVTVGGDVTGGEYGIDAAADSTVIVTGNVDAKTSGGSAVALSGDNTIVVDGTASGTYAIACNENTTEDSTIIVYQLDGKLGVLEEGETPQLVEAEGETEDLLKDIIHYIITKDLQGAEITGSEELTVGEITYETASEDDELIVDGGDIKIKSVSAGKNAKVTKNSDGTFTITVKRGGGLDIVVKLGGDDKTAIQCLETKINAGSFGTAVTDVNDIAVKYTCLSVNGNELRFKTAVDADAAARKLTLNSDLLQRMEAIKVKTLSFKVGDQLFKIDAEQLKGFDSVTITVDPATGAVTLETTGGETKAITFTFGGEEITIEA